MSFYVYLIYLVLTFIRPVEMFWPWMDEYRPMLWLWALAFVLAAVRAVSRRQIAVRPLYLGVLALFVVVIAASQVVNGWTGGALIAVSEFSPAAMLFVLTCLNLTSIERVKATCATIVVCIIAVAGFGVAAYHYGFMGDLLVLYQNMGDALNSPVLEPGTIPADDVPGARLWRVRSLGFLNDPNDLAQAVVMVLPLLWGAYRRRRLFRNLVVVGVPGAMLLYTIFLTHSRGALLGIIALLVFGVRRRLGTVRTVMLALIVVVAASVGNFGGERSYSTGEESAGERIEAWYSGLQMLRSQPVFGVGFGNFTDRNDGRTAHNSFVLSFAELGLLGSLLWVGLITGAYRELEQTIELAPADSIERKLAGLLRASLIGFMTCAWFLSRTYQPELFLLLAICLGTAYCARARFSAPDEGKTWPPISLAWPTLVVMFSAIFAVYGFILLSRMSNG